MNGFNSFQYIWYFLIFLKKISSVMFLTTISNECILLTLFSKIMDLLKLTSVRNWNLRNKKTTLAQLLRAVNLFVNLACLSVCLCVSNKRQNGWTDQAHILCGTSYVAPGKVYGKSDFKYVILKYFYLKLFNLI